MVKKIKPKVKKVYDPLPLKSLIDDYRKAMKMNGNDVPPAIAREVVMTNLNDALTKAMELVEMGLKGVDLLTAQHALAHFAFICEASTDAYEEAHRVKEPEEAPGGTGISEPDGTGEVQ